MSIFKSEQEIELHKAGNERIQQKTISENQELIDQFDDLTKKIITDLEEITKSFDSLVIIRDEIDKMPKENNLIVSAALGFDIVGNVSTTRAKIKDARKTIIERIK